MDVVDAILEALDEGLDGKALAARARLSPFHFNCLVRAGIGESPAAFRRRLLLERAAWRLSRCASVIDVVYDIEAKQNGWSFVLRERAAPSARYFLNGNQVHPSSSGKKT